MQEDSSLVKLTRLGISMSEKGPRKNGSGAEFETLMIRIESLGVVTFLFKGNTESPIAENHSGVDFDSRSCLFNATIKHTCMKKYKREASVENAGHRIAGK